ncbi:MAG: DNA primase [Halieaceae bacterium]|nr:DNA primase [Halieaceae bacterium]
MAGLIPQSFIDDLLDRADIVDVIDRRVKLKKSGKNYMACCPFHQEKTPSFSVNPEKQFFYCFGCGASGNALGFIMDYENIEFPAAVESLADSLGMSVPREQSETRAERGQRDLYPLMEEAARYYQRQLREHPRRGTAVDYLKGRGLTGEIAKRFDLGFAAPGWDNLLKALGTTEERKQQLKLTGMLVENESGRVYDRFRDRVVFPIRDQRGRVIGFGGRVLGDDKPKYLNSPETPIFHKGRELYGLYQARQANRQLERIIIVEGYMDVIALAQHGINNATATLGTATGQAHLEKIFRLCPEVVFCFDGDEAGRQAASRAMEAAIPCMQDGRSARFLFLPEGEDPDTLVRSQGAQHFQALVNAAMPLDNFLFDSLAANLSLDSLDGKARLSKLAAPLLQKLPPGVYRELMFKELAERTGMATDTLSQIVAPPPEPVSEPAPRPRQREPLAIAQSGPSNLVQTAIFLLLHQPAAARRVEDLEPLRRLEGPDVALLLELLELLQRRPESTLHMLLGHWYGTEEGELLSRLASQERLIPPEGIENEFIDTINGLLHHPKSRDFEARVDKLKHRNYADISELEKLEIVQELREKRRRDEERGRKQ